MAIRYSEEIIETMLQALVDQGLVEFIEGRAHIKVYALRIDANKGRVSFMGKGGNNLHTIETFPGLNITGQEVHYTIEFPDGATLLIPAQLG